MKSRYQQIIDKSSKKYSVQMVETIFRHSKILLVEDYRICYQKLVKLRNIYFENVMYQWLKM